MKMNRLVSVLTIMSLALCILAGYLLSSQDRDYRKVRADLLQQINELSVSASSVAANTASISEDERINAAVSTSERAEALAARVVASQESINGIMAQLDDINLEVDGDALTESLFSEYDFIDSVFGEASHLGSTPWFMVDITNPDADDFHWDYAVAKNISDATVPVLFRMQNSNGQLLAYLIAVYDSKTDSMSLVSKRWTYDSGVFMTRTVEEDGYEGDKTTDEFVSSVMALTDELSVSDDLLDADIPEPEDDDWNNLVDARDESEGVRNDPLMNP